MFATGGGVVGGGFFEVRAHRDHVTDIAAAIALLGVVCGIVAAVLLWL